MSSLNSILHHLLLPLLLVVAAAAAAAAAAACSTCSTSSQFKNINQLLQCRAKMKEISGHKLT